MTNKKPFILTIFGASGDLAKIKLFPALYELIEQHHIPKDAHIVGYARTKMSEEAFKKQIKESIQKAHKKTDTETIDRLLNHISYFSGQYDKLEDFKKFTSFLRKLTKRKKMPHLAYFAVPPVAFKPIIQNLGESRISELDDIRLILEKPFGEDFQSAQELFHFTARYFKENQIYLLDHYLGKTGVQSILNLRHSNRILNLIMKGPEIANIQITATEPLGVDDRIGYFDQVGTLKDMVQSHLLQMLALITMSIPVTGHQVSVHKEKYSILSAMRFPRNKKNIVLGQYESYTHNKAVPKSSRTETFVALRLFIDRESWFNVPIYLRTGKKLDEKHTYIAVELKKFAFQTHDEEPNRIILEISPEERLHIKLVNKHGTTSQYQAISTQDSLACGIEGCMTEYATLIAEAIRGEQIHFLSFPEILAEWELTDSIIKFKEKHGIPVRAYKDGSKGPEDQFKLTERDGFSWYDPH